MGELIQHKGIVQSVGAEKVRVRILQSSACSGCNAKQSCMAADAREKYIDCTVAEPVHAGDEVMVSVTQGQGWLAILLSFVLPFLLLMFMLWLMGRFFSEPVAGTIALCSLLPYYFAIWLLKKRVKKHFDFTATRLNHEN